MQKVWSNAKLLANARYRSLMDMRIKTSTFFRHELEAYHSYKQHLVITRRRRMKLEIGIFN
jgi:hypothetical protein